MKKGRIKIKTIRNIYELRLIKQRLEMQEILHENEMASVIAGVVDNFIFKLKGFTFDLASHLFFQLFSGMRRKKESKK